MNYIQIVTIVLGILIIIFAVLEYLFHPKSKFFILKRIIEYLDESERIKYQKAIAVPGVLFGVVIIVLGLFFIDNDIFSSIYWGSYVVWLISTLIINKIYLDYFFVWSVPK